MKNKRNKKLLASFLFALGVSTNQVNVSAKNGQIRDTLADLIWCNFAKNAERAKLEEIASDIDGLVAMLNNTYETRAKLRVQYIKIYNNLKKELAEIFSRRTSKGPGKIYSDLVLSINKNKDLSELLLDDKNAQEAQYDADNVFKFFKNANNLDFGTWSVWKRVKPSLDRLVNNAKFKEILDNELEKKSVTTSIDANGHLVVKILNSSQTVLGPLLSNDLKSKVRSVSFQGDVSNIKSLVGTFEGFNNLQSINIPDSIEEIDANTFSGCTNLKSVKFLEGSLKSINQWAFRDCVNLQSIEIPSSVGRIDMGAFRGCTNLKNVTILGNSIKSINQWVFRNCVNLQSIEIPSSVELISLDAFDNCTNLKNVKIPRTFERKVESIFPKSSQINFSYY